MDITMVPRKHPWGGEALDHLELSDLDCSFESAAPVTLDCLPRRRVRDGGEGDQDPAPAPFSTPISEAAAAEAGKALKQQDVISLIFLLVKK